MSTTPLNEQLARKLLMKTCHPSTSDPEALQCARKFYELADNAGLSIESDIYFGAPSAQSQTKVEQVQAELRRAKLDQARAQAALRSAEQKAAALLRENKTLISKLGRQDAAREDQTPAPANVLSAEETTALIVGVSKASAKHELSLKDFVTLCLVKLSGKAGVSVQEIASRIGVTPSQARLILRRLSDSSPSKPQLRKLVRSVARPNGTEMVWLITPGGAAVFQDLRKILNERSAQPSSRAAA